MLRVTLDVNDRIIGRLEIVNQSPITASLGDDLGIPCLYRVRWLPVGRGRRKGATVSHARRDGARVLAMKALAETLPKSQFVALELGDKHS